MWDVNCTDTLNSLSNIKNTSIDLIFTSPPYYGVADYVKAQRLSFLWFHRDVLPVEGYGFDDFESLRKKRQELGPNDITLESFTDYMHYMKQYIVGFHTML